MDTLLSLKSDECIAHQNQQRIPKLQILNFHDFFNQSDWFSQNPTSKTCPIWSKKIVKLRVILELVFAFSEQDM